MKYKICIVATKEIASLFSAIWADQRIVDKDTALNTLFELKKERRTPWDENSALKYWIIFVLEDYLLKISPDDYKKLSSWALPAIISIPSHKWSSGYWDIKIKQIVEKAVWSDIFW